MYTPSYRHFKPFIFFFFLGRWLRKKKGWGLSHQLQTFLAGFFVMTSYTWPHGYTSASGFNFSFWQGRCNRYRAVFFAAAAVTWPRGYCKKNKLSLQTPRKKPKTKKTNNNKGAREKKKKKRGIKMLLMPEEARTMRVADHHGSDNNRSKSDQSGKGKLYIVFFFFFFSFPFQ